MTSLRCLLVVSLLASAASAAPPYMAPDPDLDDAPAACIDAVRPGKLLGTYRLVDGKALDTPRMRLRAYGHFMPERLGSTRGEVIAHFEAQLLPELTRDGENPHNSVDTSAPGSLRIDTYRVTTRVLAAKPGKKLVYEATIEDLGCRERYVHAPLKAGESKTLWVSTEGVMDYSFSTGAWWSNDNMMTVHLSAGLAPDVQQDDKARPHGWVNFQAWEREHVYPVSKDAYHGTLAPGFKLVVDEHVVEVLEVRYGKDTVVKDDRLVTTGKDPVVSLRVRVTRNPAATPAPMK